MNKFVLLVVAAGVLYSCGSDKQPQAPPQYQPPVTVVYPPMQQSGCSVQSALPTVAPVLVPEPNPPYIMDRPMPRSYVWPEGSYVRVPGGYMRTH